MSEDKLYFTDESLAMFVEETKRYTESDTQAKLLEAKSYTDTAVDTAKNDLLNGAGAAYDTLKELGDLISENVDAIDALEIVANGKQNKLTGAENQVVQIDASGEAVAAELELITVGDIDSICGGSISYAEDVMF